MKQTLLHWSLALVVVAASSTTLFAQGMMGGPREDPAKGLAAVFGNSAAFTSQARTTVKKSPTAKPMTFEFSYALLEGRARVEMDMTKIAGTGAGKEDVDMMKQLGMDRMVTIHDPGKKVSWLVYPGLKAYCEIPLSKDHTCDPNGKIERTELGKETIDGHPCVKWKVITTDPGGEKQEATVWTATDLKDFPIQCETATGKGGTATTLFQNIDTSKPDASLFEVPSDYKKYGSMQEMMMGSMQRMMQ